MGPRCEYKDLDGSYLRKYKLRAFFLQELMQSFKLQQHKIGCHWKRRV